MEVDPAKDSIPEEDSRNTPPPAAAFSARSPAPVATALTVPAPAINMLAVAAATESATPPPSLPRYTSPVALPLRVVPEDTTVPARPCRLRVASLAR